MRCKFCSHKHTTIIKYEFPLRIFFKNMLLCLYDSKSNKKGIKSAYEASSPLGWHLSLARAQTQKGSESTYHDAHVWALAEDNVLHSCSRNFTLTQGSHSLEKSLYFIVNPWKVLDCQKSLNYTVLKSPWIFPNIESEASQQSCIVKFRVFFCFNFAKKDTKKRIEKANTSQNVSRHQIDPRFWIWVETLLCMPHGTGLTLRSWSVVLAFVLQQNAWKVQF